MTATAFAAPITRPATTAPRGRLRWAIEQSTVSTPALTEGVEASRNNRIGTHLVDNGPLADLLRQLLPTEPHRAFERGTARTPALTVETLRNNQIGARLLDDGLRADPAGPEVVAALVRAGVPVHGAQRQRGDQQELFARPTESGADNETLEGDLR